MQLFLQPLTTTKLFEGDWQGLMCTEVAVARPICWRQHQGKETPDLTFPSCTLHTWHSLVLTPSGADGFRCPLTSWNSVAPTEKTQKGRVELTFLAQNDFTTAGIRILLPRLPARLPSFWALPRGYLKARGWGEWSQLSAETGRPAPRLHKPTSPWAC